MTRPASFEPLSGSDQTPGDEYETRQLARRYQDTADEIGRQADNLRRLSETDGWNTDAGRTFSSKAAELADHIVKAQDKYQNAADALFGWAGDLATHQEAADEAVRRAQAAQADVEANQPGAPLPDDATQAEKNAERQRGADLGLAQGQLNSARGDYDDAVSQYEDRAGHWEDEIRDNDDLKDGFWDKFTDAVLDVMEVVSQVLDVILPILSVLSTILTIAAVFFPVLAPFAAALELVVVGLTALKLLCDVTLALTGRGDWSAVIGGIIGLASFGIGKGLGRLAKTQLSTAKSVATQANTTAATAASRQAVSQAGGPLKVGLARGGNALMSRVGLGPIARRTTGPFLDDLAANTTRLVNASQRPITVVEDFPGVLNTLRYGGIKSAQEIMTARNLATTFPEVATDMPNLMRNVRVAAYGRQGLDTFNFGYTLSQTDWDDANWRDVLKVGTSGVKVGT